MQTKNREALIAEPSRLGPDYSFRYAILLPAQSQRCFPGKPKVAVAEIAAKAVKPEKQGCAGLRHIRIPPRLI
jgi:hypothetical protein